MSAGLRYAAILPPRGGTPTETLQPQITVTTTLTAATRTATLSPAVHVTTTLNSQAVSQGDTTQTFTLLINEAPTSITGPPNPITVLNTAMTNVVYATAGYPMPTFDHPALPTGLTWLDPESTDGLITLSGTPTAAAGDYPVTLTATNTIGTTSVDLLISIWPTAGGPNPVTSTAYLTSFSITRQIQVGQTPALIATGPGHINLRAPADTNMYIGGPTCSPTTGYLVLSAANCHLELHDGEAVYGILPPTDQTPPPPIAPTITSADTTTLTQNQFYAITITATGTPTPALTLVGGLPAGLTFTPHPDGTATIAGTPTQTGTFNLVITAHSTAAPDATQPYTLTVTPVSTTVAPQITSADHTLFTQNTLSTFTITATGNPVPALTRTGSMPPGLTFTDHGNGTATLAGTSTTTGVANMTLHATNTAGTYDQPFALTVQPAQTVTPIYCPVTPNPAVNSTAALEAWIATQPDGSVLDFNSMTGAKYRSDGVWNNTQHSSCRGLRILSRVNLTIQNLYLYTDWVDPDATIDSATAVAQMSASPSQWTHGTLFRPRGYMWLQQCTNVTLNNVEVRGPTRQPANVAPFPTASYGYRANLEAQHGFQWTGCTNCVATNCTDTYVWGDGLCINAYNEGHEATGATVPSDGITITNHMHRYNGRQGFTVANGSNVHFDGTLFGSQRSLVDLEPETSGETAPPGMPTGQVDDHIDMGPVQAGWHLNNMINVAGGGDNYNLTFHDWTTLPPDAGDTNTAHTVDGSVGFSSGQGFPAHPGGFRRQGPISLTNMGTYTVQAGHPALYGGPAGVAQFNHVDGVHIDNYHVAVQAGRGMVVASMADCTDLSATNISCFNGSDIAWDMSAPATAVTVTGASLTSSVATLTVNPGHGLSAGGQKIGTYISDPRYNVVAGVQLTAVTSTTLTYAKTNLVGGVATDIPFAAVTGTVNPGAAV